MARLLEVGIMFHICFCSFPVLQNMGSMCVSQQCIMGSEAAWKRTFYSVRKREDFLKVAPMKADKTKRISLLEFKMVL